MRISKRLKKVMLFSTAVVVIGSSFMVMAISNNKPPLLPERASNAADIYTGQKQEKLFSPVSFMIQPMERLMLINFEADPDDVYIGFEPQVFDDDVHGRGFLVIAWRTDGYVDVYHQPSMNLNPDMYQITGKGLMQMSERPLKDAFLEIGANGVSTYFSFEDTKGREIEVQVRESSSKKRKPFGLLAPMGDAVENPTSMPLVLLKDFYFVRRADTKVMIRIDERIHQPDALPLPIDFQTMYFIRYSPDPLILLLNPDANTVLHPLTIVDKKTAVSDQLQYDLVHHADQLEIQTIRGSQNGQIVELHFSPALPNLVNLKDQIKLEGEFFITGDVFLGMISGIYKIKKQQETVQMELIPADGWQPYEKKMSVNFLYYINDMFKKWPSTYRWQAVIDLSEPEIVHIESKWKREN